MPSSANPAIDALSSEFRCRPLRLLSDVHSRMDTPLAAHDQAWFTARCETQNGVSQPIAHSLMTLADGPKWKRLEEKFTMGDSFGMPEQALQNVDPTTQMDVLEQSMRRWVSALTLLGGEYRSFGAHFQSMPNDLDEEDVLEIHRRAVG
jgi:hypothetical protein